ncbi:uncharacterized protein CPUR_02466 [Claviceps purpurea 20.1]|uniref:Microbial-type PARG catalytic domain-containing protein n=1 Tax=Claviceps purpurea (strain 20.1) TaxID=1111077 RepID=M1VV24_CLAP2|nr:uncharacterized protein CPUR_02466 [Claviceps purpurea 20.1]
MDAGNPPQHVAGGTENLLPMPRGLPPVLSSPISYDSRTINLTRHTQSTSPPEFRVVHGDPVKVALDYGKSGIRVPFICAANRRGPGLRHNDQRPTYEKDFCDRSNLYDTLTRTRSGMDGTPLYPIPTTGGIFSDRVAVYLGLREDNYKSLDPIPDLPVVSVSPVRNPRVKVNGSLYSYCTDESTMREKICGALRICLHNNYDRAVIGDFGLGDGFHNPPQVVAETWRNLLLFDPDLCGQFESVDFAFVDPMQSTTQVFWDKKEKINEGNRADHAAKEGTFPSTQGESLSSRRAPTDMAIFESVFHPDEIKRVREVAAST